jgi:ribonucleotide monophosphatase NagD (HAD superfamily)
MDTALQKHPVELHVLLALVLQGKQVLFMTNNSMKSRQSYLDKCLQVGLPAHVVSKQGSCCTSPDLFFAAASNPNMQQQFMQPVEESAAVGHASKHLWSSS